MADFDERSGVIPCTTPWGLWYQTIDEVFVEIQVPPGTKGKDVKCDVHPRKLKVVVGGKTVIEVRYGQ